MRVFPVEQAWHSRVPGEICLPEMQTFENELRGHEWADGTRIVVLPSTFQWGVVNDERQQDVSRLFPRSLSGSAQEVALKLAQAGFGPGSPKVKYAYPDAGISGIPGSLNAVNDAETRAIWSLQSDDYYCRLIPAAAYKGPNVIQFADGSQVTVTEEGKRYLGTHLPVLESGPTYRYELKVPGGTLALDRVPANVADCFRMLVANGYGPAYDTKYALSFSLATFVRTNAPDLLLWMWPDGSMIYLVVSEKYPHGAWFACKTMSGPELIWTPGTGSPAQPSRWAALALLVREFCGPSARPQIAADSSPAAYPDKERLDQFICFLCTLHRIQQEVKPAVLSSAPAPSPEPAPKPDLPVLPPESVPLNVSREPWIKYPETDEYASYRNLVTMPEVVFTGSFEDACLVVIAQLQHGLEMVMDCLKEWDIDVIEQRIKEDNPEAGMVEYYEAARIMDNYIRFYTAYKAKFTFPHYTPVTQFKDSEESLVQDLSKRRRRRQIIDSMADAYLFRILEDFKQWSACPICGEQLSVAAECSHCQINVSERVRQYLKSKEFKKSCRSVPIPFTRKLIRKLVVMLEKKALSYHVLHECDKWECSICRGGLSLCTVCGGAEASLPTHCPGRRMTEIEEDGVSNHGWDFYEGKFQKRRKS